MPDFLTLADLDDMASVDSRWDLVIVGSGPVGLTLSRELSATNRRILVVESGRRELDPSLADLDHFENSGSPRVPDPARLRARVLGGTSSIWSGRCAPFDAIDFEQRPWVPFSGWPIDADDVLTSYSDRALKHLGLSDHPCGDKVWHHLGKPMPAVVTGRLSSQFWQYSRDRRNPRSYMNFGISHLPIRNGNVDLLLGATVTSLMASNDGRRIAGVALAATDGRRRTLQAKTVVLCAGGIENARLLLLLRRCGGAVSDAAGRYLMDHPRCVIGYFDVGQMRDVTRIFGLFRLAGSTISHGVKLSNTMQREERLLNCAAWLTEMRAEDDPWTAIKQVACRGRIRMRDAATLIENSPLIVRGLWRHAVEGRPPLHKCDAILLDCNVEQAPNPENRIMLSEQRDRFGTPLARIQWTVGPVERATVARFARVIATELERVEGPRLQLSRWIEDQNDDAAVMIDAAHPMGSTRISSDPRLGAADANCQIYDVDGLFVAGSSTFPTSSHANPTLMALILTVRLADHLKARWQRHP